MVLNKASAVDGAATLEDGSLFHDQAFGDDIAHNAAGGQKCDALRGMDGTADLAAHNDNTGLDVGIHNAGATHENLALGDEVALEVAVNADEVADLEFAAEFGALADKAIEYQ